DDSTIRLALAPGVSRGPGQEGLRCWHRRDNAPADVRTRTAGGRGHRVEGGDKEREASLRYTPAAGVARSDVAGERRRRQGGKHFLECVKRGLLCLSIRREVSYSDK